jgi:hypothetical protein
MIALEQASKRQHRYIQVHFGFQLVLRVNGIESGSCTSEWVS